jgi:mannose-6-phosphate isomerase-like protein (cupin superfamily)
MRPVPRRVVTGHTPGGVSVVVSDGPVPVSRELPGDGVAFHEIWNTAGAPARITAVEPVDPTERELAVPPPARGTKIRINDFAPGHLDERGLQSPVHRTASVDYGIVLEGEITLVLEDSEVTLRAGDVVVQRGTDHAWANRGTAPARVAFILVDGEFDESLAATLPAGALTGLMHGGPRD